MTTCYTAWAVNIWAQGSLSMFLTGCIAGFISGWLIEYYRQKFAVSAGRRKQLDETLQVCIGWSSACLEQTRSLPVSAWPLDLGPSPALKEAVSFLQIYLDESFTDTIHGAMDLYSLDPQEIAGYDLTPNQRKIIADLEQLETSLRQFHDCVVDVSFLSKKRIRQIWSQSKYITESETEVPEPDAL